MLPWPRPTVSEPWTRHHSSGCRFVLVSLYLSSFIFGYALFQTLTHQTLGLAPQVDYWVDPGFGEQFFNSCKVGVADGIARL